MPVRQRFWPRSMNRAELPLASCRALLVRPSSGDTQLQEQLRAAGATVTHCPVMALEPLADVAERVAELAAAVAEGGLALFVSRTAAAIALQQAPSWPVEGSYFAVGQSTAGLLRAGGLEVAAPAQQQTSEGLLALPGLASLAGRRAVIVAGQGGRELIAQRLAERGAQVSRCELYRRLPEPAGQLAAQAALAECDLLLAHSGELLELLEPVAVKPARLVVPSERVARLAERLGYRQIAVAASAAASAMAAAAIQLWQQRDE